MTREEGDPCSKIEKIIRIAEETKVKPAFSLITGDVSQNGSTSGYRIAKEYISQIESLGGPVLPVMGNVDNRTRFRENLLPETKMEADTPCYYSITIKDIRIIVLDSLNPGKETGTLGDEQLDWLKKELIHQNEPTFIAMHHPPFTLHLPNGRTHTVFDIGSIEKFQGIVKNSNVTAVICGHMHQSLNTTNKGTQYSVGPAALSELYIGDNRKIYDASGFTQYTLHENQFTVRPIVFTEGRHLILTKSI